MSNLLENKAITCPQCGKRVDPLRAPAVSIIEGHITHFCSASCRARRLNRLPAPEPERQSRTTDHATDGTADPEEDLAEAPLGIALSSQSPVTPFQSKWLIHQAAHCGIVALIALLIVFLPPLAGGLGLVAIAGIAILASIGSVAWRERRMSAARLAEVMATPIAAAAILSSVGLGRPPRFVSFAAVMILAAESLGRLSELVGRFRSGVLHTVEGSTALSVPSSWRDNSETAAKVRQLSIMLGWARYPMAFLCTLGTYFFSSVVTSDALLAGATALMAINPRTLRMATGDAHLCAALRAIKKNVTIRDAHAVDRLAQSRIMLFIAKRSLFKGPMAVVDWHVGEEIKEQVALDALYASEANAEGSIAVAVREFAMSRKARATSPCTVETIPGHGIMSETPLGRVICGSRMALMENGISTALLEPHADIIETSGRRAIFLAIGDTIAAVFGIEEGLTLSVKEATTQLLHMGLIPAMVISSEVKAAQSLATRLGMVRVYFESSEEMLQHLIEEIAATADRAAIIGHGTGFEENIQSAHSAIAFGNMDDTQAGINARNNGILTVPWLVRTARRASLSATRNLVAGIATVLFGLGLAASWFSPMVAVFVASASAAVAAGCTWNSPFPFWDRIRDRARNDWRRIRSLVTRKRSAGQ